MRRSFRFRLRPTGRQHVALDACLRDHRTLYNAALEERREAWRRGISVRYGGQSAQLKEIRQECPEQGRWSFSSQQATLRRLNRAFDSFFRRVTSLQRPGYPHSALPFIITLETARSAMLGCALQEINRLDFHVEPVLCLPILLD